MSTHTEHTPAWIRKNFPDAPTITHILVGEQVGRAIARDALDLFRSEGMPLTWTGIEIDDGDVLLSAGLEPDTPQWEAAESAARDEFYRCTSTVEGGAMIKLKPTIDATPTPWFVMDGIPAGGGIAIGPELPTVGHHAQICFNGGESEANAKLIVKAVNSHERLIQALSELVAEHDVSNENIPMGYGPKPDTFGIELARAALAEGE